MWTFKAQQTSSRLQANADDSLDLVFALMREHAHRLEPVELREAYASFREALSAEVEDDLNIKEQNSDNAAVGS